MDVRVSLKSFSTYASVGLLNTLIHWSIFLLLHGVLTVRQAFSNACAFAVAATFSFHANSRYTFRRSASWLRYLLFIGFMGFLSLATGWLGDYWSMPGLLTLVVFSAVSLVLGYFYSRHVIFRGRAL